MDVCVGMVGGDMMEISSVGRSGAIRRVRRAIRWVFLFLLPVVLVFGAAGDTFTLNPAQQVALPYRYSITGWEVRNLPDKWVHLLRTKLSGRERPEAERVDELRRYFDLGRDLADANHALNRAMSDQNAADTTELQDEVERLSDERSALRDGVEETIESALSTAIRESGLSEWERFVLSLIHI